VVRLHRLKPGGRWKAIRRPPLILGGRVAQLVERRSPKPQVVGSSPTTPATRRLNDSACRDDPSERHVLEDPV
jgi:hypothetical protein